MQSIGSISFVKFNSITAMSFIVLMLVTMSFENCGTAIILCFFLLKIKEFTITRNELYFLLAVLPILIVAYILGLNVNILRFILYIPRFLIIKFVIEKMFEHFSYQSLTDLLKKVFFFHCIVILLCFAVPPFNVLLNRVLGKSGMSDFRISGLFSGYDFVSFVTIVYLYVEYRCNGYKFTKTGYLQLFLGLSATVVSGRFGLVPYVVFLLYIFFSNITITKIIAFFSACLVMFYIFYDRIMLVYSTFLLVRDYVQLGDKAGGKLSLSDYGSESQSGFYDLSPLTLYNEATLPFRDLANYLLPSLSPTTIDSGPSFVILNIGLLLTIALYIFYFKEIYQSVKHTAVLTVFFLLMDTKFRSILVLMPTVWMLVNIARLQKRELSLN